MLRILGALILLLAGGPGAALELADPTRPISSAAPAPGAGPAAASWRLSLVRLSGDDRSAVLNGKLVREGDRVGSARVMRIEPSQIVLDQGGSTVRVVLAGSPVKSPAGGAAGRTRPRSGYRQP